MAKKKSWIEPRCGSFKGAEKKKCIDSVRRSAKEGEKHRKQSYKEYDREGREYDALEKKYGKAGVKAIYEIENKKRYGKEWSKRGKKK